MVWERSASSVVWDRRASEGLNWFRLGGVQAVKPAPVTLFHWPCWEPETGRIAQQWRTLAFVVEVPARLRRCWIVSIMEFGWSRCILQPACQEVIYFYDAHRFRLLRRRTQGPRARLRAGAGLGAVSQPEEPQHGSGRRGGRAHGALPLGDPRAVARHRERPRQAGKDRRGAGRRRDLRPRICKRDRPRPRGRHRGEDGGQRQEVPGREGEGPRRKAHGGLRVPGYAVTPWAER